jgi:uncharacterized protein (TIGR00730 family)
MTGLERVCLFCASSPGIDKVFFDDAEILAKEMVKHDIAVNYGGGAVGLMGRVADVMLAGGGSVTGYIPHFMVKMEWAHPGVTEMVKVNDMHERKYLMRQNVDAAIALPGGVGTLEELMEIITLKQLGQFTKPIIILNTGQFYEPLLKLLNNMSRRKFMRDIHETLWQVVNSPGEVIPAILNSPAWDSSAIKYAAVLKR